MKAPRLLFLLAAALLPCTLLPAPPKSGKTPGAKIASKAKARPRSARKRIAPRRRHASPRGQQQPEPQRIREIQQALAEKGYPVESTGAWDAATVEALKKFQTDHQITNFSGRGKLDPLTLIALGLGPRQQRQPPPDAAGPASKPEGKTP